MADDTDDPRTTGDHVRRLRSGGTGDVILVGVVHDHPASKYRVGATVDAVDPEVLALELPPLAVPLYERYGDDDDRAPPRHGGEMSAAVQAATTDRVVGIDGPSARFGYRLARTLASENASASAYRSALRSLSTVTKRAVACRLTAVLGERTDRRPDVGESTDHDCEWTDDPADQARHERSQIRQARTIRDTFGQSDTASVREDARNDHMADRLSALRGDGDVVAVVGIAHLDPLTDRLDDGAD